MLVPYQQMNAFFINAYKPIYTDVFDNGSFNFSLRNYIKSQIHLNIVTDLYNRDLRTYTRAQKYLRGDDRYFSEFCKVLKYYYYDVGNMILKSKPLAEHMDISIDTYVGFDIPIKVEKLLLNDTVEDVNNLLNGNLSDYKVQPSMINILNDLPFKLISSLEPTPTIALAVKLLYYSNIEENVLLEVR